MSQRSPQLLEITPRKGWASLGLGEVWEFRGLLYHLTAREIKGRYRQMALGPLWIILKPFMAMVVFSIVFGTMAKLPSDGMPYPLFSYAALLPWQLFSVSVSKSSASLITNMAVISKVYFPRLLVPLAASGGGLVDFFMSFGILLGMMFWYGFYPGWNMLLLPAYILLALATALALGLWLATLAVKFRDVSFGVDHALQILMYLTPVVYPSSMVQQPWCDYYMLNPMAVVIDGFRWSLLGKGQPPTLSSLGVAACVVLVLLTGAFILRRFERSIVDIQ